MSDPNINFSWILVLWISCRVFLERWREGKRVQNGGAPKGGCP